MPGDWTIAFDTLLTHRLTHCTTCGTRGIVSWGMASAAAVVVAYGVCQGCYRQDPDCGQAVRVLEARYETG